MPTLSKLVDGSGQWHAQTDIRQAIGKDVGDTVAISLEERIR